MIAPAFWEARGVKHAHLQGNGRFRLAEQIHEMVAVTKHHGSRYDNWMKSILERGKFNMDRIHIVIAIVIVLSALKKFEDILVQYSKDVEAGRFNIEDCPCILGSARYQAPLYPPNQGPSSGLPNRFMAGDCNKMAVPSL